MFFVYVYILIFRIFLRYTEHKIINKILYGTRIVDRIKSELYSIKFSPVYVTNIIFSTTLFALSPNFSIQTSYSHFRELSLGFPPCVERRCRGAATPLIDHQRSIGRALFTLSLSTAKFPKVRRRAQRHSATAFVRLRSLRGSVPSRRKRPRSSVARTIRTFALAHFCEAKKSEEKKRKNLRTLARPPDLRVHRSMDDKSSNGLRCIGCLRQRRDSFLAARREERNLRDLPSGDRAISTYEITRDAPGIFLRRGNVCIWRKSAGSHQDVSPQNRNIPSRDPLIRAHIGAWEAIFTSSISMFLCFSILLTAAVSSK